KVGDSVQKDEPIFEISTDKVDAEIPSPVAGTLLEIKVSEGQTVAINTVVARIGEAGEQPAASAAPAAKAPEPPKVEPPKPASPAPPPAAPKPAEAAAPAPPPPSKAAPPPAAPRPPAGPPAAPPPVSAQGGTIESFEERVRTRSSPLVRKIAQENGVDI